MVLAVAFSGGSTRAKRANRLDRGKRTNGRVTECGERNRRNLIPACGYCEIRAIRAIGCARGPLERMRPKNEFFKGPFTEADEARNPLLQELNAGTMGSDHSL